MTTFSSSTASVLVLVLSAGVVVVAGAGAGFEGAVKAACAGTPDPVTCFNVLSPSANASNTASECAVALLASKAASSLLNETDFKLRAVYGEASKNDTARLSGCISKINDGYMDVSGKDWFDDREDQKVTVSLVRRFIERSKAENIVWSCKRCRSLGSKNVVEVAKGGKVEKYMAVLYALVDKVPATIDC
ncbi:unnamed protein product [Alopecurus aequalis]